MMRPRLLDLYCCAGGAAMGYHRAGFDVTGVDIAPQKRYPFRFIQADALEYVAAHGHEYDAIHASPPCQKYSEANKIWKRDYPDLIAATRSVLARVGTPYVIENVEGAPLLNPARLCGTFFGLGADGWELRRHRLFEASFALMSTPCNHRLPPMSVFGDNPGPAVKRRYGRTHGIAERRQAMGIGWMTRRELSEAIPPAYTEYIGAQLLRIVERGAA